MAPIQILPPGTNSQTYADFFDKLSDIVGPENISRDASDGGLEGPDGEKCYGDPYPLDNGTMHVPSGAVRPRQVEEIQAILQIAGKFKIPLWTISRGKNLGYGGTSPVVRGSVVLDLHRMNRIIEVNGEYGYAVVEPGVSFFDLYEEIQRQKLDLWPSCPAIGWGSVVGNTLDRGLGYTPNGEHSQAQCGMEVILPTGEILRTGMGAMEGNATFPLFKGGYGPSIDGLFYQSNLGVVTKLGIHLTPAPESYMGISVSVPREGDLVDLIGILSSLQRRGVIWNSPSVLNPFRQAVTSPHPSIRSKIMPYCGPNKSVPEEILDEIRQEQGWGYWAAQFGLYGSVEMVPAMLLTVRRAFENVDGAKIHTRPASVGFGESLKAEDAPFEEIPHTGIPTLDPLQLMNYRQPGSGHIAFSPILPPSGRELYKWYLSAKEFTKKAKFDFFADFHVYPRYVLSIELVVFAPEERSRVNELYLALLSDAERQGLSEYRTHVQYMDLVKRHYSFNQGALGGFTDVLKQTLDPNAILAPGKSGIWGSGTTAGRTAPML
ncbi:FAD-linked oxidase-like protein [Neofusicoccum parvum]|uniref:FAD-linked oxidase-like protein n=1 Tax=Neofusicoccum parvum TaxID=310453 RepID=A0ACB5SEL6_9PEZI|nr:FAD-linked oxidase-like protein [Neofusicoccum parvum]